MSEGVVHVHGWVPFLVLSYVGTPFEKYLPVMLCGGCLMSREPSRKEYSGVVWGGVERVTGRDAFVV